MKRLRVLSWMVALPFVGACSFCDTPLVCASDANCPAPQRCVDDLCAIAPLDDAGPGEGEGEGGGDGEGEGEEGEGEGGEGEGEGGEGEGEGGEGEGEGGEGEGEPVDAGPDCVDATFCQAAQCDGAVDADGHAVVNISGVDTNTFCFEHDAEVWTLVTKVDGDDSGLSFSSSDQSGWNAVLRNAGEATDNRDFGDGENALLHGYEGIEATELLVGFNSLSVDDVGVPPAVLIPVFVPGIPRDLKTLVFSNESFVADDIEVALWIAALGPAETGEQLPDFSTASAPCIAFGRAFNGFGVRLGLLDDCDAPTRFIGIGAKGCDKDDSVGFPDISADEPTAGACELQGPGDSNIVVRAGYILAR